jgi:hypothetical protein
MKNRLTATFFLVAIFALGFLFGKLGNAQPAASANAEQKGRVFEIRTYTTEPGRLDALNARFRDHTTKLFAKHGITNIGYWTPQDAPLSQNTLIYILAHPSREAAQKNWDEFRNDPEWKKAREESEASGKIVNKVESVFVNPTDYSPLK